MSQHPQRPGQPVRHQEILWKGSGFYPLHWRDDPRKGEAWYANKVATLDPVTVAQEIDIDYSASVEGIMIPAAWVRAAVGLQLTKSGRRVAGQDVAAFGRDRNVNIDRTGPVVESIDEWGPVQHGPDRQQGRREGH